MKYSEVICSPDFPELNQAERNIFLQLLADLDSHTVTTVNGAVVEITDGKINWGGISYLVNWKWDDSIYMGIATGVTNPDPNFVDFILDYAMRVGLYEYEDNENSRLEFENVMKGACSLIRAAGQLKFPFRAEVAFQAWVKAHNRGRTFNNVEK